MFNMCVYLCFFMYIYGLLPEIKHYYILLLLHFPKFNNFCHFSDHFTNLSRSFCKCCLSPSVLTFLNTFVSSANFSMLLVILLSKSLVYIKNNKSPNTDPCGTPLKTDFLFETSPSISQPLLYPVNYDTIGF